MRRRGDCDRYQGSILVRRGRPAVVKPCRGFRHNDSVCGERYQFTVRFAFLAGHLLFAVSISVEASRRSALLFCFVRLHGSYDAVLLVLLRPAWKPIRANTTAAANVVCLCHICWKPEIWLSAAARFFVACSNGLEYLRSLLPTGFSEQKKHATSPPIHHTRQKLVQASVNHALTTLPFTSASVWRVRGCRTPATRIVSGGEISTNARLGKK